MDYSENKILTNKAPLPFGHYSQGAIHNGCIFVSGQLAAHPDGTHGYKDPFAKQVRQCLENLIEIVIEGGGTKESILKVTAYVVGVEYWQEFNDVYSEVFGDAVPARAVVPVPALHHGYLIELDAVASI